MYISINTHTLFHTHKHTGVRLLDSEPTGRHSNQNNSNGYKSRAPETVVKGNNVGRMRGRWTCNARSLHVKVIPLECSITQSL